MISTNRWSYSCK